MIETSIFLHKDDHMLDGRVVRLCRSYYYNERSENNQEHRVFQKNLTVETLNHMTAHKHTKAAATTAS